MDPLIVGVLVYIAVMLTYIQNRLARIQDKMDADE